MANPEPMTAERLAEIQAFSAQSPKCQCEACRAIRDLLDERERMANEITALSTPSRAG